VELSKMSKRMIMMVGVSALVFMLAGAVFYRSPAALPFAFGVLIPAALNILKIAMLDRTVKKVIDMDDPNTGKNYVRLQYLLRYLLTGLVLLGIGLVHTRTDPPLISIWGAVAGIFTMQISVIICRSMKLDDADATVGSENGGDNVDNVNSENNGDEINISGNDENGGEININSNDENGNENDENKYDKPDENDENNY